MSTEQTAESFTLNELQFTLNKKPYCVIEFDITANPELVASSKKEAIKKISKQVSLPGFRKGKAPENLVVKNYAKAVEEETKKTLASQSFQLCQNQVKIPLLNHDAPINFNVESLTPEGAKLKILFEAAPNVPEISIESIRLDEVNRPNIDEARVQEGMRTILHIFSSWEPITDRPAADGDFVLIDLENIETDPSERIMDDMRFEISKEKMADWMYQAAIGLKPGESCECLSEPDKDLSDEERGKFIPTKVRLTVKSIEKANLPEITDEFAQKIGAKDVDDFKRNVKKNLDAQADDFVTKNKRDQIANYLAENYSFDVPQSLIQKETQSRLRSRLYEPKFLEEWKNLSEENRKELVEEMKNEAEKALRLFFICRKIASDAEIKIPKEEIQKEMETPFSPIQGTGSEMQASNEEKEALALSRLMLAKAQDYIIDKLSS